MYFDQLLGAARTRKLIELLFSAVFNLFCSFPTFFSDFMSEINRNFWKRTKKCFFFSFCLLLKAGWNTKQLIVISLITKFSVLSRSTNSLNFYHKQLLKRSQLEMKAKIMLMSMPIDEQAQSIYRAARWFQFKGAKICLRLIGFKRTVGVFLQLTPQCRLEVNK